ncbi:MBOAT family O-acyltransferase [Rhodopirellula bahusiensis]|uniref:Alginate O-acetyltransferase n=1 Tax=Rhodopirellula bahusiensis TaxID=2014065 RepID=A0A2G1W4W1_9BACT|nr:MBOAT family protein [Rhodopirellula bahusiensis]PHQ34066.1 alginate O-acetyltransferase [Rhodopirellula bahusiensis]
MNFTQLEFLCFLAVVVSIAWMLRGRTSRNAFLLVASYYFYAYWDIRFCGLLLLSTAVDFVVAKRIAASDDDTIRKRWLLCSLVVNLGMLGVFKYFNFFLETAEPFVRAIGLNASTLPIVLPVGISFFTFQTLSYTIDVYRRKMRPTDSVLDFALYVAFFPQLVAGPIVRASHLLPQLSVTPGWNSKRMYNGAQQLLRGAVKKVLIADHLADLVDGVFAGPELYHSATIWLAVLAYAGQIYYDFSGYSDMAIGIAKMLGYRFPVNFRHPYLATSVGEFWHRWHITLSTWLRDYLFIPLGGSRGSTWQTNRNLMITMSLGGLWHGAAMTFLSWGILHGLALITARTITQPLPRIAGWFATMCVVGFGWVLFRATSFENAMSVYRGMLGWVTPLSIPGTETWSVAGTILWLPPLPLLALGCMVVEHLIWRTRGRRWMRLPANRWYTPVATAVMIWALVLYAPRGFRPFVYFQF